MLSQLSGLLSLIQNKSGADAPGEKAPRDGDFAEIFRETGAHREEPEGEPPVVSAPTGDPEETGAEETGDTVATATPAPEETAEHDEGEDRVPFRTSRDGEPLAAAPQGQTPIARDRDPAQPVAERDRTRSAQGDTTDRTAHGLGRGTARTRSTSAAGSGAQATPIRQQAAPESAPNADARTTTASAVAAPVQGDPARSDGPAPVARMSAQPPEDMAAHRASALEIPANRNLAEKGGSPSQRGGEPSSVSPLVRPAAASREAPPPETPPARSPTDRPATAEAQPPSPLASRSTDRGPAPRKAAAAEAPARPAGSPGRELPDAGDMRPQLRILSENRTTGDKKTAEDAHMRQSRPVAAPQPGSRQTAESHVISRASEVASGRTGQETQARPAPKNTGVSGGSSAAQTIPPAMAKPPSPRTAAAPAEAVPRSSIPVSAASGEVPVTERHPVRTPPETAAPTKQPVHPGSAQTPMAPAAATVRAGVAAPAAAGTATAPDAETSRQTSAGENPPRTVSAPIAPARAPSASQTEIAAGSSRQAPSPVAARSTDASAASLRGTQVSPGLRPTRMRPEPSDPPAPARVVSPRAGAGTVGQSPSGAALQEADTRPAARTASPASAMPTDIAETAPRSRIQTAPSPVGTTETKGRGEGPDRTAIPQPVTGTPKAEADPVPLRQERPAAAARAEVQPRPAPIRADVAPDAPAAANGPARPNPAAMAPEAQAAARIVGRAPEHAEADPAVPRSNGSPATADSPISRETTRTAYPAMSARSEATPLRMDGRAERAAAPAGGGPTTPPGTVMQDTMAPARPEPASPGAGAPHTPPPLAPAMQPAPARPRPRYGSDPSSSLPEPRMRTEREPRHAAEGSASATRTIAAAAPTPQTAAIPVTAAAPLQPGSVLAPGIADPEADPAQEELSPLAPPPDTRQSSGTAPHAPQQARGEPGAAVARQVAEALAQRQGDRVELRLEPEELGRVQFRMQHTEHGLVLAISADRPETLDLLRRHSDLLSAHLEDLGYDSASFSFGEGGTDRGASHHAPPLATTTDDTANGLSRQGTAPPPLRDGLDLRV